MTTTSTRAGDSSASSATHWLRLGMSVARIARSMGRRIAAMCLPGLAIVTPLGWTALTAALVLFVLAWWGGWTEMAIGTAALLAAVAAALLFAVGRVAYRVELDLRTTRVVVDELASGRMVVANAASRKLLPSQLELPIGTGVGRIAIPSLAPGSEHEELFVVPTHRRGVIMVGPARSVRGDAFGLVRREVRWTEPQPLYVHPRTTSLTGAVAGFFKDLEGQPTDDLSNDDVSFHALRAYVPGDDRRYIHWRTSARSGDLMVRQFEETRRSHVAVALSVDSAEYAHPDDFELAVEAGASLVVQAAKESRELTLVSGTASGRSQPVRRTLDELSAVELHDRPRRQVSSGGILDAARRVSEVAPQASIVFLLCGSIPTPAQIRLAGSAAPFGARVVAVRSVAGVAPTVRRISGITVVTVGSLDHLARTLRQARR